MDKMFNKKDISLELAASMENNLIGNTIEKQAEGLNKYAKAIENLSDAAETFDSLGLNKEAEALTTFLEIVAGKKAKKKPAKSKSKAKKKTKMDSATKGLTGEKMVENLKEKGWVFNADDTNNSSDSNDSVGHSAGCMCSMCMDVNDIRHGDDCVCSICMKKDENDIKNHKSGNESHRCEQCGKHTALLPKHPKEALYRNDETGEYLCHSCSGGDKNDHFDTEEDAWHHIEDEDDNYAEMFKAFDNDFEDEV